MSDKTNTRQSLGRKASGLVSSYYPGQLLGVLITSVTFVLITRILGPSGYGIYVFAFGFAGLVDAFGNFGIGSYVSRNISKFGSAGDKHGISKTVSIGYALLLPMALLLSLVGAGLSPYVASVFSKAGTDTLALILVSLFIFFAMLESTSVHMLLGFGKGKEAALLNISVDIMQLIASVSLALEFGTNGAIAGTLIGYVIGAALAVYTVYALMKSRHIAMRMPSRAELSGALGFAAPLGVNNFMNVAAQNLAIMLLGIYASKVAIGNYGVAMKGLAVITIVYSTMATLLLPIFAASGASPRRKKGLYSKILTYSIAFTMPLVLYMAVFSRAGVYLLLSKSYGSAPLYLTLMSVGIMISLPSFYLIILIISEGHTLKILKYNLLVFLIEIASLFLLVGWLRLGPAGNIIAVFFIGGVLQNIFMIRIMKRVLGSGPDMGRLARIYLSNAALGVLLLLVLLIREPYIELAAGLAMLIMVYPIVLFAFRALDSRDIESIRKSTEGVPFIGCAVGTFARVLGAFSHCT